MKKNLLLPLPKTSQPSKKTVFDIETIGWNEPYAIDHYDGTHHKIYAGKDCIKNFLDDFIAKTNRDSTCYAHNAGKFDFAFILEELINGKYHERFEIRPMRINSRIAQIKITEYVTTKDGKKKNQRNWTLRDSYPILPFSLRNLAKNYKVPTQKGEINYDKIKWTNYEKLEYYWRPYLEADCEALYQILDKHEKYMIQTYGVNLKKNITLAQTAMNTYRANSQKEPIQTYEHAEEDIRQAYYGGRVEIHTHYGKNLNYYDVNSEYPWAMKKPQPTGIPLKSWAMSINDFGIAKAKITTPNNIDVPVLPYRTKDKKLIFPTGTWTGWYCTPELQEAERQGYKIQILEGYKFKQEQIFDHYIDTLYDKKNNSEKDSIDYITSKLLMNSLYGKFGQKRERESFVIFPKSTEGLTPIDFFGELPFYSKKVTSKSKHILPAIAAMVTCYGRLKIYEYMKTIKDQGGQIYYCDTDSVITDITLPTGRNLGELKLEYHIDEGIFILPKMYALKIGTKTVIRLKGFPHTKTCTCKKNPSCELCKGTGQVDLFTWAEFNHALRQKDMTKFVYEKDILATPFESMRRNKTFNSMIHWTRSVKATYDKRSPTTEWHTKPLVVETE